MTEGVVTGGWGFVWAAYALTAAGFIIYGVMLMTRLREAEKND
ncbi:MAG TPA: hypothetical protein VHL59_08900 [Thermoanaerobaculia bacterium]|nr:hypothetical protein [Thermoanaerobaculia bacterium]